MDISKFRGETIGALKAIAKDLDEIKKEQRRLADNLTTHCRDYNTLNIRIAKIAGSISVITSIIIGIAVVVGAGII